LGSARLEMNETLRTLGNVYIECSRSDDDEKILWWMCRESVREEIMMNKWTDDCRFSLRLKGKSELIY